MPISRDSESGDIRSGDPDSGPIVHSETPYNAEPPLGRLRSALITAQRDFYVRNHGELPRVDERAHRLHVGGRVAVSLELSMADLRERFPRRTVTAVLQCAGNRRSEMFQVRPVSGDPWAPGAIGNAEWTGVSLADLLRASGAEQNAALHIAFAACDECEIDGERFRYAASIPIAKAMSPEVLLAYGMNGEPLSPEHGFPLRAIVPGFAGVRSAKWLTAVAVQDAPAESPVQAKDYRLFPSAATKESAAREKGITIYDMPLTSAICEPLSGADLRVGPTAVRGYATASARGIVRVDVSRDGGRTWVQAELRHDPAAPWSWTFWQATLDLPAGEHELVVRAWDSAGQGQPSLVEDVWNFKGYLNAAWHRVRVSAR